ncbi:unnamed protein product, partial [Symbiodinium necroappetens]
VTLRRWFNWDQNWKSFRGHWTALAIIFKFRQRALGGAETKASAAKSSLSLNPDQEDPAHTGAPGEASAVVPRERKTKDWILSDLREQTKGDMQVMCAVLNNSDIHTLAEMLPASICSDRRPLFRAHLETLEALEQVETAVQWQADRANRCWIRDVRELLQMLNRIDVLRNIKIRSPQDVARADVFFRLVVSLAAVRTWCSLLYDLPPEQLAGILSNNAEEAFDALASAKRTAGVIRSARAAAADSGHPEREA